MRVTRPTAPPAPRRYNGGMSSKTLERGERVFAGVRFDVYALELNRRSGGTARREVVVPADAVVILPLLAGEGPNSGLPPGAGDVSLGGRGSPLRKQGVASPGAKGGDGPDSAEQEPRVVLIRNERFTVGKTLWELPAGTVERGEELEATAGRELEEETGYAADRLTRLTAFYPTPGFCTERMTAYLAQGLTHRGQALDETENITVEAKSWGETMQMVRDGRIEDGKTIATLLYYACFVRGSV